MNEDVVVMAYIGPGAGLASIGALLTLIGDPDRGCRADGIGVYMVSSEARGAEVEGAACREKEFGAGLKDFALV